MVKKFPLISGTWQGYPLLLLLFNTILNNPTQCNKVRKSEVITFGKNELKMSLFTVYYCLYRKSPSIYKTEGHRDKEQETKREWKYVII